MLFRSERVDVGLVIERVLLDLLGRHVGRRADVRLERLDHAHVEDRPPAFETLTDRERFLKALAAMQDPLRPTTLLSNALSALWQIGWTAVLTAMPADLPESEIQSTPATQWLVVTDLGLSTLRGPDGVDVFVRSLASAKPVAGANVALLARNNAELGRATTDADGRVHFPPSGAGGGNEPLLLLGSDGPSWVAPRDAPLDPDPAALRNALWLVTDERYKEALSNFLKKRSRDVYREEAEPRALEVLAGRQAEPVPPERGPGEEQRGREGEAPGHRDLGGHDAELALDGEPGRSPDERGEEEEEDVRRGAGPRRRRGRARWRPRGSARRSATRARGRMPA